MDINITTKKCPKCGHENVADNQFCEKCGNSLTNPELPKCPKCGAEVSLSTVFCPKCGNKIAESSAENKSKPSSEAKQLKSSKNNKLIIIALAAIVAIVALMFMLRDKISYELDTDNDGSELVAKVNGKTIRSKIKHKDIAIGTITKGDDVDEIELKVVDGQIDDSKTVTFDRKNLNFFDPTKKIKFQRTGNKIFLNEDATETKNGKLVKYTKQTQLGNVKIVFASPSEIKTDSKPDQPNYEGISVNNYDIDGDGKKDRVVFYQTSNHNCVVQNHASDIVIKFANGKKSSLTSPANLVCIMKSQHNGVSDIITTAEGFRNHFAVYHWNGNYFEEIPNDDFISQMERKSQYKPEPEEFDVSGATIWYYPTEDGDENEEKVFVKYDGKTYRYGVYWQQGGIVEVVHHQGFDEIIFNWNMGNTVEGQSELMFNRDTKNFTYLRNVADRIEYSSYSKSYTVYIGDKTYTIADGSKKLEEKKTSRYNSYFGY